MRVMLVLRGAPGCGKSTFVQENNLKEFKISMDDIRVALYGYEPRVDGTLSIPQKFNKKVFEIYQKTLEERMKREEFLVVDNTHTKTRDLRILKKLCQKYQYRMFIKDFTDYSDKDKYFYKLKSRNEERTIEQHIPEDVLKNMINNLYESINELGSYNFIDEMSEITYRKSNLDAYEKVMLLGDIHGNYYPFEEALKLADKNTAIILTGDYVDRGTENDKVIEKIYELIQQDNVFILRGNHEIWLKAHAEGRDEDIRSGVYKNYTKLEIESIPDWHKKIKEISKKLLQCFYFEFDGQDYFVSHAAISYWNPMIINYDLYDLCKGREDTDTQENQWNVDGHKNNYPWQIHGHINSKAGMLQNELVFNLNSDIEFGGRMPVLILEKGKLPEIKIITDDHNYSESERDKKIINLMRQSRNINIKDLGHNIQSYNFKPEVFREKDWDHLTTKARGLFYSKEKEAIVARGYDKFFNYGELSDKLEDLDIDDISYEEEWLLQEKEWLEINRDKIKFPVDAYEKSNGFLGIVSLVDENLLFCSKSNAIMEYDVFSEDDTSMYYPRIVRDILKNKDKVKNVLKNLNKENETYSLVFEVIDPVRDPHIVEYSEQKLVLLDVIKNNARKTNKLPYKDVKLIAEAIGEEVKKHLYRFEDFEEMINFIKKYKEEKLYAEGLVFEDQNGFMFKLKTDWYTNRKRERSRLQSRIKLLKIQKNKRNDIPLETYDDTGVFGDWIKSKTIEYLDRSFIDVYNDFLLEI